jgi:hypothetical protein
VIFSLNSLKKERKILRNPCLLNECPLLSLRACLALPNRRITNHLRILGIHESRIASQLPQKTPRLLDRPSLLRLLHCLRRPFHCWHPPDFHIPSADIEKSHFNHPHQSAHWRSNVKTKQSTNTTDDIYHPDFNRKTIHQSIGTIVCTDTGFIQFTHSTLTIAQTLRIYKQDLSALYRILPPPKLVTVIHPQNKASET